MKHEFKLQFGLHIIIVILLIFISSKNFFRFDFSKNKIYTLTKYTKNIFENLNEELTLTWIASDNVKKFFPNVNYLEELLKQYASLNNCTFEIQNSSTLSQTALTNLDIYPQQITSSTRDEERLVNVYSAVLIEYKGMTKVLPYVFDLQEIEYTIANNVLALIEDSEGLSQKRFVYILTFPKALDTNYIYVTPFLEYENFIPIRVHEENLTSLNSEIPLIVIGSSFITDEQIQMIDSFLQAGGNAAFFISGVKIDVDGNWACTPKVNDKLLSLLADYGFIIAQDLLLDIFNFPLNMTSTDGRTSEIINYPFWLRINSEQADLSQAFFSGFNTLQMYWASSLDLDLRLNKNLKPVLTTSSQAKRMFEKFLTDPFLFSEKNTESLEKNKYILAAISESKQKIFVTTDENILSRCIEFTNSDANIKTLCAITQWLNNKEELLKLKNKISTLAPFKTFEKENVITDTKIFSQVLNLLVVPLIILLVFIFKIFFINANKKIQASEV
ncbi:MAG: GldG family protein [Treponemataceae bacterium]